MPRLFTGLEIPAGVGFTLSLKRGGLQGAHWIGPENYHIKLRYIGDVNNQTANDVVDVLLQFTQNIQFPVRLNQLGVFGGKRPRALYAGVEVNPELARLQTAQERALQQIGLPPEGRKFSPHVTLARLRGTGGGEMAQFMAEAPWFEPLLFNAGRFVLYSSRESVGGGPYVVEQAYDLSAIEATLSNRPVLASSMRSST